MRHPVELHGLERAPRHATIRGVPTWVPAVAATIAVLISVRVARQVLPLASVALAAGSMWAFGRFVARRLLRAPGVGPWTSVYLGQLAALAGGAVVSALNGATAAFTGYAIPLPWIIAPAAAAAVLAELRSRRGETPGDTDGSPWLLALIGVGSLATVVAIYSRHLSALGLDIHQHLAWARQIVVAGHVPLAEPGTRILGDYPRSFHLLAALWNAAGLAAPAGPYLKMMPYLQTALPALALAEALEHDARRQAPAARRAWEIALGLGFFVYVFLLVPTVFPVLDLIGTPRFSCCGILLLPPILAVVARVHCAPRAAALAWAGLPAVGTWALTWNPIVPVQLTLATLPVLAALTLIARPPVAGTARFAVGAAASAGLLAALVIVQDPWVVSMAASRSPAVAALVGRAGLVTFDEAVRRGEATARDKMVHAPARPTPPCEDAACVRDVVARAARETAGWPSRAIGTAWDELGRLVREPSIATSKRALHGAMPLQPTSLGDHVALPFALVVTAAVVVAIVGVVRRRREAPAPGRAADAFLLAAVVGLSLAHLGCDLAARIAAALSDGTHEAVVQAGYLGGGSYQLSLGFLALAFLPAWVVLSRSMIGAAFARRVQTLRSRRARIALATAGLAVWLLLPTLGKLNVRTAERHGGFWGRIGYADLDALRSVEAAIPPEDGVIVPAEHWNIADWEHWVIPVGQTTALLPYGNRRYLFDVYLGASYPLGWRDLEERACSQDRSVRARFFERVRARWFVVLDRDARDGADAAQRTKMCGEPLTAFGVELQPARAVEGLYLFRLRPDA
jgi:hypothetical protein